MSQKKKTRAPATSQAVSQENPVVAPKKAELGPMKTRIIVAGVVAIALVGAFYGLVAPTMKSVEHQVTQTAFAAKAAPSQKAQSASVSLPAIVTAADSPRTQAVKQAPQTHAETTKATLVGEWVTTGAEGVTAGVMQFTVDGKVTLHPEGFPPVSGKFVVSDEWLNMSLPSMGEAMAQVLFSADKKTMTLSYDNGLRQVFTKK